MHKNKAWLLFLAIITCVVVWFVGKALFSLKEYYDLTASTSPKTIEWSSQEIKSDVFALRVQYTYVVTEKSYKGEMTLKQPRLYNPWAAQQAVTEFQAKKWKVWYSPSNPKISSLQKNFPFKECLYAALLLGILLYFIWLGYYVGKTHPEK